MAGELLSPINTSSSELTSIEETMFHALDISGAGRIRSDDFLHFLRVCGLRSDDLRIRHLVSELTGEARPEELTLPGFRELLKGSGLLVQKAIQGELIIPNFSSFCEQIEQIYHKTKVNQAGKVANYIPQLGRIAPENYGVSVCTIDGQQFSIGDATKYFSIQSISKPINYCLALEEHGEEVVHRHVGREPSGHSFNAIALDSLKRPHNPMINAGAIMSAALIGAGLEPAERFDSVLEQWRRVCGGGEPHFNNAVYLSEKQTADRNFALAYFMRENKGFPQGTNLLQTLDLYFQCCSIELTVEMMAVTAATLAKSGICPMTGERVFAPSSVKNCLSLMYSCGLYDFSGEWAFSVGLPAKSGVGGGLMVVIPNLMGICIWSPPLDALGNSVRGIEFCRELIQTFNFHNYDSLLSGQSEKADPRLKKNAAKIDQVMALCFAASQGDLREVQHLIASGVDPNEGDYDGRTCLHLAASEGHENIVQYFVRFGVKLSPKDRWGGTPLEDAQREGHDAIVELLRQNTSQDSTL